MGQLIKSHKPIYNRRMVTLLLLHRRRCHFCYLYEFFMPRPKDAHSHTQQSSINRTKLISTEIEAE